MIACQISGCPEDAGDKGLCKKHRQEEIERLQDWVATERYKPENAPKSLADLEAMLPELKKPRIPVSSTPYKKMGGASESKKKKLRICKLEFCDKVIRKRDAVYCSWHLRHYQAGLPLAPIPDEQPTVCEVPSCHANPEKVGFCRLHFYQLRQHGKIIEIVDCSNDDCTNPGLPEKPLCKQCHNFRVSQSDQRIRETTP